MSIPADINHQQESLTVADDATVSTKPHQATLEGVSGPKHWDFKRPDICLVDRYADEPRTLRVAVIGAGISGIIAGVLLPAKVPGIELTIFEKNADVVSCTSQPGFRSARSNVHRVGRGSKIYTLAYAATFRHTYIRPPSNQIRNGPRNTRRVKR